MTTTSNSACSSGCKTQDHASWGECVRAKNAKVAWANSASNLDRSAAKKWQSDIDAYRAARRQGIVPDGSNRAQVDLAVKLSNETGQAYVSNK